jgi:septum site-determining protein MinD
VGCPVTLHNPGSPAAQAYSEAARRLLGDNVAVSIPREKQGFMSRLFGRKAVA